MRKRKKGLSQVMKTIPLSIAVTALSSGMLFANAGQYDVIKVELPGGGYAIIDPTNPNDLARLREAFLNENNSIVFVDLEGKEQIEFGKNAHDGVTLEDMWTEPDKYQPSLKDAY